MKGSKYIGVYKCNKTNRFYFKSKQNNSYYKSRFYINEKMTAIKYDKFILRRKQNIGTQNRNSIFHITRRKSGFIDSKNKHRKF